MAKKKKSPVVPVGERIPKDQLDLAARFFTISNMGQPEPDSVQGIRQAYANLEGEIEMEAASTLDDEYDYWYKDARDGGEYITREWKEKIYPFLKGRDGAWEIEDAK